MKCNYCGGNLSLETEVCPHCGRINEQAKKHVEDMRRFTNEYQDTKKDVYTTTRRYTGVTVRLVIAAIFMILAIVAFIMSEFVFHIYRSVQKNKADAHYDEYCEQIMQYMEDGEYLEADSFFDEKVVDCYDTKYEGYVPLMRALSYYEYVWGICMSTYSRYGEDTLDLESESARISEYVSSFYDALDADHYYYLDEKEIAKSFIYYDDLDTSVQRLLISFCGVSQEDAANMKDLSKAKRAVIIEDAIIAKVEAQNETVDQEDTQAMEVE